MFRITSSDQLYHSRGGYETTLAHYNRMLRGWPVALQSRYVPTRYGHTHVVVSGPESAPPLVLLHGVGVNAMMWKPNIEALSRHRRVYAVDIIGDTGRSAPTRPSLNDRSYFHWLLDVFDALHLEQADLVGVSFGGWLALNFMHLAPRRLRQTVLLCPAGLTPVRRSFIMSVGRAMLFRSKVQRREIAHDLTCHAPHQTDPEMTQMIYNSLEHHRTKMALLPLLDDSQLQSLQVPSLLLVGEQDVIFDAGAMVQRAQAKMSCLMQAEVVKHCGHAITTDQQTHIENRINAFLTGWLTEMPTQVAPIPQPKVVLAQAAAV